MNRKITTLGEMREFALAFIKASNDNETECYINQEDIHVFLDVIDYYGLYYLATYDPETMQYKIKIFQ